jgi:uncharacterized protein (TIGR02117 family)
MARFCVMALALLTGCSWLPRATVSEYARAQSEVQLASFEEPETRTVYITSNGFHTGLVVRRADVSREAWPEIENGSTQPWVEVGWGSEVFYRAKLITPIVVAKALAPNASVLHIVNWPESPERIFAGRLVRLELAPEQFDAMCRFISETYANEDGSAEFLGPGIYGESAFYRGRDRYYFPNTCNVWTARALQEAGVTIIPELCASAQAVMLAVSRAETAVER